MSGTGDVIKEIRVEISGEYINDIRKCARSNRSLIGRLDDDSTGVREYLGALTVVMPKAARIAKRYDIDVEYVLNDLVNEVRKMEGQGQ